MSSLLVAAVLPVAAGWVATPRVDGPAGCKRVRNRATVALVESWFDRGIRLRPDESVKSGDQREIVGNAYAVQAPMVDMGDGFGVSFVSQPRRLCCRPVRQLLICSCTLTMLLCRAVCRARTFPGSPPTPRPRGEKMA